MEGGTVQRPCPPLLISWAPSAFPPGGGPVSLRMDVLLWEE